jgi:GNAT superfamily N-acetyltransferase
MRIDVHAVDGSRWEDLTALFGPNGAYSGCWCMWWRRSAQEFRDNGGAGNKAALRALVREQAPVGLIGYADGEPVGWCALAPRPAYPRLLRSNTLRLGDPEDESVWSLPCLFVHRGHRRRGVATAMLEAAVGQARDRGAVVLEAYPVETAGRARLASAELYTGTVSLMAAAGFTVHDRPASGRRVVMRLKL